MKEEVERFEIRQASRKSVWVWIAMFGPSGSGKTCSLLRIASGLQDVCGGSIDVVDTENHRAERYAPSVPGAYEPGTFKFRHVDLLPPFDPMRYYFAVKQCVDEGARVVIVDSMTHEHTGTGGVLEQHVAETEQLAARWKSTPDKCNQAAWIPIKARRAKAMELMQRLPAHILFAFRAKEKTKPDAKGRPQDLGFMAIGGEDWIYECELSGLLLPGAEGVPTWTSRDVGSRLMIKKPGYLQSVVDRQGALSEETGRIIGRWAQSSTVPAPTPEMSAAGIGMLGRLNAINTGSEIREVKPDLEREFPRTHQDHAALSKAFGEAVERAKANAKRPVEPTPSEHQLESSAPTGSE